MSGVDAAFTREEAISEAKKIWDRSASAAEAFVKMLEAFGVIRFKPTPKQAIQDTLAGVVLPPNSSTAASTADPKMGGWWVGPAGAAELLKALDEGGYYIGKQEVLYPPR